MTADKDAASGHLGVKGEVRIVERAIRQRWPIPEDKRASLMARLVEVAEQSEDARVVVNAVRTLVAADRLNLEQEKLDAGTAAPQPAGEETDVVSRIGHLEQAFVRNAGRQGEGGPGGDRPGEPVHPAPGP